MPNISVPTGFAFRTFPAPLWTPADASANLIAWWDASDASTVTESSGQVSEWRDKGPNGHDLQTVGGGSPEWGLGAQINGLNVMHYASTFDNMEAVVSPSQSFTHGMAITAGMAKTAGDYPAYFHMNSTDGLWVLDMRMQCDPTSGRIANAFQLNGTNYNITSSYSAELAEEVAMIDSFWWDGLAAYNYANGGSVTASVDVPDGLTFIVDNFGVGRYNNTPRNYQGELVLYNSVDTALRQKCEGYLAWKWGTVGNLDASHPYKHAAPTI